MGEHWWGFCVGEIRRFILNIGSNCISFLEKRTEGKKISRECWKKNENKYKEINEKVFVMCVYNLMISYIHLLKCTKGNGPGICLHFKLLLYCFSSIKTPNKDTIYYNYVLLNVKKYIFNLFSSKICAGVQIFIILH